MAILATSPAFAADGCNLRLVASVGMSTDSEGGTDVPMTIAGKPVNLLIDTGGVDSMLTQNTVSTLGLFSDRLGGYLLMYGRKKIDHYASARDVVFGGLTAPRMRFLVMPDGVMPPELGGTLAPDVLRAYDDDFDFANAKFNLVSPNHCPGQVVYWTKEPYAQIALDLDPWAM
ncbi:MAG: retropepsin-like aspartic protease, partial [Pirellulales bacterium]